MSLPQIEPYYVEELAALRKSAREFSFAHEKVAEELRLIDGQSADPHVNLLLESFAYLFGRLRMQLDMQAHESSMRLLELAAPELARPRPSMSIARLNVDPEAANFENAVVIRRGRVFSGIEGESQLRAEAVNRFGESRPCRFTTAYETPIWPFKVDRVSVNPAKNFQFLKKRNDDIDFSSVKAVLTIKLRYEGKNEIASLEALQSMRFFINPEVAPGYALYEALESTVIGVASCVDDGQTSERVNTGTLNDNFRWLGFAPDESMFPESVGEHQGCRLFLEYVACPEKFLFFEVNGIDGAQGNDSLEVMLLLDRLPAGLNGLSQESVEVNCTPVVNLYEQAIEPINLEEGRLEYPVTGQWAHQSTSEIYSISGLHLVGDSGRVKALPEYVSGPMDASDAQYVARRSLFDQSQISGTQVSLSLVGGGETKFGETIGGTAWCCDRRLPEKLGPGYEFELIGPGPTRTATLLTRPSKHQVPIGLTKRPWVLVGQLQRNVVSLASRSDVARALRDELLSFVQEDDELAVNQIGSLSQAECKAGVTRVHMDGHFAFARGIKVKIALDDFGINRGSRVLFASVLRHYLALFVPINTYVELELSRKPQGAVKWQPMLGTQIELL